MSNVSMCGGPPGNHSRITDVSGVSRRASFAWARIRNRLLTPRPPRPIEQRLRKPRRDRGPGQGVAGEGIQQNSEGGRAMREYYFIRVPNASQAAAWEMNFTTRGTKGRTQKAQRKERIRGKPVKSFPLSYPLFLFVP